MSMANPFSKAAATAVLGLRRVQAVGRVVNGLTLLITGPSSLEFLTVENRRFEVQSIPEKEDSSSVLKTRKQWWGKSRFLSHPLG